MADNDEGGPSKKFWEMSMEEEEARANESDDEEMGEFSEEDEGTTDSGAGDAEGFCTGSGTGGDDTTDGGERTDGSQAKRQRRDRRANTLGATREVFTHVSESGTPLEPSDFAKSYSAQVACILRDTVSINTENIRHSSREHLRTLLVQKLHRRYKFPEEYDNTRLTKNVVNKSALTKMSTALASWRSRVKKMITDGKTNEEISKKEMVPEDDVEVFRARCQTARAKTLSTWGTTMRSKNIGNHHLGAGGYRAKERIWEKEDAERAANSQPSQFDKFTDKRVKNFVRARYGEHPVTKELVTDQKVHDFEKYVVRNTPP